MSGPALYEDPNRFARPASLELYENSAVFHGYQEFQLTPESVRVAPVDEPLERKRALITRALDRSMLAGRSVLDLGANGGFFGFWSLLAGARDATAVDMDEQYVAMMRDAAGRLDYRGFKAARANVVEWSEPADVVYALALIHWIYSCTAALGTLDAAVGLLARLTNQTLIVEWVDPEDPAIRSFGHLGFNAEVVSGPYDRPTFEAALDAHFARWRRIGEVTTTRALYLAERRPSTIDPTCPMPPLHEQGLVISCRLLTRRNGVEYWSRVYGLGDRIVKQTTGGLASHEAAILRRLDGPSFPRVLRTGAEADTDVVELERIDGEPLRDLAKSLAADRATAGRFAGAILRMLAALARAGVQHRDIHAENVLVREGLPVLLDFGWATADGDRIFAPPGLGGAGRPPDGVFDDLYSTGVMLRDLGLGDALGPVLGLMSADDPALRVSDPARLLELLRARGVEVDG